jgi:hypothetical protein
MPTPHEGESRKDFVSRCIPIVIDEGTAEDSDQAVAVCNSMWRDKKERGMEEKETESTEEKMRGWVPFGITSFAEADAALEAEEVAEDVHARTSQFQDMVNSVMGSSEVEDKAGAIERLSTEFVTLVKERLGDILGKARKPKEDPAPDTGLMLWKEADGLYHWIARYSNNFRDEDNPPEIISETSHRRFVDLVDKGNADLPELWLWHVEDWKWGTTDWVAWDDAGFAVAGGTVDKGQEPLAEALAEVPTDQLRVSHGMPKKSIVRDPDDDTIIVEHLTREISPLPAWAAANSMTGFIMSKEAKMAIPDEKLTELREEWNLSDEILDTLQAANAAEAEDGKQAGIEQKDKDEEPTEEVKAETETEVEPEPEPEPEAEPGVSRAELQEALEAIGQAITALSGQIKEIKGQVTEVEETKTVEEAVTLSEIFERAIGHKEARVDGRTSEAKDRPAETQEDKPGVLDSGNPLADSIINSIVSGDWKTELGQPQ